MGGHPTITQLVLDAVRSAPMGASSRALAAHLCLPEEAVMDALKHWCARGEITLRNEVAKAVDWRGR